MSWTVFWTAAPAVLVIAGFLVNYGMNRAKQGEIERRINEKVETYTSEISGLEARLKEMETESNRLGKELSQLQGTCIERHKSVDRRLDSGHETFKSLENTVKELAKAVAKMDGMLSGIDSKIDTLKSMQSSQIAPA